MSECHSGAVVLLARVILESGSTQDQQVLVAFDHLLATTAVPRALLWLVARRRCVSLAALMRLMVTCSATCVGEWSVCVCVCVCFRGTLDWSKTLWLSCPPGRAL
jgi:hypothetical protein